MKHFRSLQLLLISLWAAVLGCSSDEAPASSAVCGDGTRTGSEQCDLTDLGGTSCKSLGYALGGTLACSAGCTYDTAGCVGDPTPACPETPCKDSVCVEGVCIAHCAEGAVAGACVCDGTVRADGYCCSGKHQAGPCTVLACDEGAIASACDCGGELQSSGYCCSGTHQPTPCSVPACDEGQVLFSCTCGSAVVDTGYCCQGSHQTGACNFTVHYVSNSGDDANSGTSPAAPWKSLAKVQTADLKPGDAVLFRRGDEWVGTLTIQASGAAGNPIVFGAYDKGVRPKLYGSETVTDWTQHSGSIFKASFPKPIAQLFLDGARMRLARYPNQGYVSVSSLQSSTQFTANALDAALDYTGATWFGRTDYWIMETMQVTASNSKTLTLGSAPSSHLNVGEGFILMNKLAFLDQPGEWFYDSSTSTVYLWTPNGDSPSSYTIRGTVHDNGVVANNKDHVTVRDLEILHQAKAGIHSPNSDSFTIKNNEIAFQEEVGIRNDSASVNMVIADNVIRGVNGIGIWLWAANKLLVTDNRIYDVAVWDGIGNAGIFRINAGSAMEIEGSEHVIRYNRVIGTGGVGIFYRGAATIEYNFVQNVCLIKDDGGGIYTNTSGSSATIRQNIVLDAVGTPEGFTSTRSMAEGIYVDEIAAGVTVEGNTVARCGNSGIKLHKNAGTVVRYNTIMDARQSIHVLGSSGTKSDIHHNIMFAASAQDDYLERQVFINSASGNAQYDYNTYVNPYATSGVFQAESIYRDFPGWQAFTNGESNSTFDGTPLGTGQSPELFYNDTKSPKTFQLTATYKALDGTLVSSLTLEPFSSQILIRQ
jgi:parallel beta-helix repeat protein